MEPSKFKFNSLRSVLDNLVITSSKHIVTVYYPRSEIDDIPYPENRYVLVTEFDREPLYKFKENLLKVREEIEMNLSIIDDPTKTGLYLEEILAYYSFLDKRIIEDKNGNLQCDCFKLKKIHKDTFYDSKNYTYDDFLKDFKVALRNEYKLTKELLKGGNQKEITNMKNYDKPIMNWTRNINDLVELVRALKLSGAINNSSNNLTLDEAYRFFGDLFGVEIKRPEDQLRQKAETMKKQFFLEELNEVFQKDMKELMKRRMQ